ncbi:single-stranded DNA-binding protein [Streptomyces sp. NPDC005529]
MLLTMIGNPVDAPELRFRPTGVPVARFTVASTPRAFDRETNSRRDGEPTFLDRTAWRQLADNVDDPWTTASTVRPATPADDARAVDKAPV